MKTRGSTFVELIITIAITALVLGAVTSLFGFASVRLSDTYTKSMLFDQVNGVADRVEATIRNANWCDSRDLGETLRCAMPLDGADTDGDGEADSYYPDGAYASGEELYSTGRYVWFYSAGPTGNYFSGTGQVWRAERSGSFSPNPSHVDNTFAYYYGTKLRYPLVTSFTFSVDAAAKTVTYTVHASTRIGAETSSGTVNDSTSRFMPLTRTVQWRH